MEISSIEISPDTAVITLAGAVMMGPESDQITDFVKDLLQHSKRNLIFDTAAVTKIDSTGIGRFIASFNQVTAAGGKMRIAAAPAFVLRAFRVCRLNMVFPFYATVEEACQAN